MRHLAAQAEEPENCILAPVRNRQVGPDAPLDGLVAEAPLGLHRQRFDVAGHAAADVVQIDFPVLLSGGSQTDMQRKSASPSFSYATGPSICDRLGSDIAGLLES